MNKERIKLKKVSKEYKIGIIVTASILMLYWGANFLSGNNILNPQVEYLVKYKNLGGLKSSNEVTYEGAKVGSVTDVTYVENKKDGYCWIVRFSVTREGVVLKDSTIATVAGDGLLGTMMLELKKINLGENELNPEDTLVGVMAESLSELINGQIAPLKAKTDDLLKELNTLVVGFREVLDSNTQNNLKKSFASIPKAINNIRHATESMDTIVDELKRARIANIVDNIASITNNIKNQNATISSVLENLDNITDSLAKANVKQTVERVNDALGQANEIIAKINNGEGSVGMLLNDKQLYENLVLATADLDFLLMDVKQNPGRYLNISMLNFGSKKQKTLEPRDSAEYANFFREAARRAGIIQEIDSVKLEKVINEAIDKKKPE